jgi:hypothetical protein
MMANFEVIDGNKSHTGVIHTQGHHCQ